eukprot:gene5929-9759_t
MGNQLGGKFYDLEEITTSKKTQFWKMYNAKMNENSNEVTVFEFSGTEELLMECSQKSLSAIKQLRHPSILKYVDNQIVDKNNFYLATSRVVPLVNVLQQLEASEILLGLSEIVDAIKFIHSYEKNHNNINLESIYVTVDKQRKFVLGDFFFYSDKNDEKFLDKVKTLRKETTKSDFDSFLNLISTLKKYLGTTLQNEKFSNFHEFLDLEVIKNDSFIHLMSFLSDMQVKSNKEKEEFFKNLDSEIRGLPLELVKKRLLPRFLSFPFFTEPSSIYFMKFFLTPSKENSKNSGLLSEDEFQSLMIPFLKTCFSSKNRSLRLKLLQTLDYFVMNLDLIYTEKYLADIILDGIYDLNDDLVMHSMDALIILSRNLSKTKNGLHVINTKILPSLHQFVVSHEIPMSLRSHALSCLIKNWSIGQIKRGIILSAIEKSIYDESFELKLHLLNNILMHLQYFDPRYLVSVILNMILPLALHEKIEVRSKTARVIKGILSHIDDVNIEKYNYGKVTSKEFNVTVDTIFPVTSHNKIIRIQKFKGSGPNILATLKMKENNEEFEVKETMKIEKIETVIKKENDETVVVKTEEIKVKTEEVIDKIDEILDEKKMNNDDEDEEQSWEDWNNEEDKKIEEIQKKISNERSISKPPTPVSKVTSSVAPSKKIKQMGAEEDDDEDQNRPEEPDYFSQLGMEKEIETKKSTKKTPKQNTQTKKESTPKVVIHQKNDKKSKKKSKKKEIKQEEEEDVGDVKLDLGQDEVLNSDIQLEGGWGTNLLSESNDNPDQVVETDDVNSING